MTREEQRAKAAHEYIQSDSVAAGNEVLAFGDFINGAKWADFLPHWIPVEERLPKEKGKLFLVCDKYGRVCESAYDVEDDIWYRQSGVVLNPTHWMPMPEAPRKQQY